MKVVLNQLNGNNGTVIIPNHKHMQVNNTVLEIVFWTLCECHDILVSTKAKWEVKVGDIQPTLN